MSWKPGEPVRLETGRYFLRSLELGDATERYLSWLKDPEVNKFLEVRLQESSLDRICAYIASHDNRSSFLLGIFNKEDGLHIGNYSIRCHLYHQTASVGVMIGDLQFWGRRTVPETRAAVLDFLFNELGMFKADGGCYSNNIPAIFNYKAQGYRNEGILKSHRVSGEKRVDIFMFAMFRDDWLAKR